MDTRTRRFRAISVDEDHDAMTVTLRERPFVRGLAIAAGTTCLGVALGVSIATGFAALSSPFVTAMIAVPAGVGVLALARAYAPGAAGPLNALASLGSLGGALGLGWLASIMALGPPSVSMAVAAAAMLVLAGVFAVAASRRLDRVVVTTRELILEAGRQQAVVPLESVASLTRRGRAIALTREDGTPHSRTFGHDLDEETAQQLFERITEARTRRLLTMEEEAPPPASLQRLRGVVHE